jgi:hypothetical protein
MVKILDYGTFPKDDDDAIFLYSDERTVAMMNMWKICVIVLAIYFK